MNEEITSVSEIQGKDRVEKIEELDSEVILTVQGKENNIRVIHIPKKYIDFVENYIQSMKVGEMSSIIELADCLVREFNIQSKIIEKRIPNIKSIILNIGLDEIRTNYIIEDIRKDIEIMAMPWTEFIGERKAETSYYFRLWGCLRYFSEKRIIKYTQRGNFYREI